MKSVIEEGSSISKAIEAGWLKAGKPKEFTVKIFQEAKKNFFGFTKIAAKVAIFFHEEVKEKSQYRPRSNNPNNPRPNTSSRPNNPNSRPNNPNSNPNRSQDSRSNSPSNPNARPSNPNNPNNPNRNPDRPVQKFVKKDDIKPR